MYRVAVSCRGLSEAEGSAAPPDILAEFAQRPWHHSLSCTWERGVLLLTGENDFDSTGEAMLDEFWDSVHAYVNYGGAVQFRVESVVEVSPNAP